MGKSTLELAVETGKWDAGLKKGVSSLNSFIDHAGGLQKALEADSAKMQKFVGMMGNFESTAKTAKGQMNDYKGTIEQLTMQYNRMTDAQKKSIGSAYLQSIDQLKQKYHEVNEEIKEMSRSMNDIKAPDLGGGGDSGGLLSGIKGKLGGDGAMAVLGGNLMTKGIMMAGEAVSSFANEIGDCIKQGIELAKQGEGIRNAFDRLGRGDILQGLREATHGTVTDLELMKAAVKFNDFNLPIEELGTMLAFAQQKAKDTGQSVDYMVDSIVTGLGRKSLMILDNLGLSAAEIKDKMSETGDMTKAVGEIIREQMASAGEYVETAADRAAQANVNLQNKMEEVGRLMAPLEEASSNLWNSMKIGILNVISGPLSRLINGLTEAGQVMNSYQDMGGSGKSGAMLTNLRGAKDKQGLYQKQLDKFDKKIAEYEQYLKDDEAWREGLKKNNTNIAAGDRKRAFEKRTGVEFYGDAKANLGAIRKQRAEYVQGAQLILSPTSNNTTTTPTTTLPTTQPKGKSDKERATELVADAERTYADTMKKAALRVKSGMDTQLEYDKKELSAKESLFSAYGKAYNTYADPKYKEAQDAAAAEIVKLGGEVKTATEAQKSAEQATREQEAAAKKLAGAQEKLAEAQQTLADANASGDLKAIYAAQKGVETAQAGVVKAGGSVETPSGGVALPVTVNYTTSNMEAFIGKLKEDLSKAEVGSELFNKITEQMSDSSAISAILGTAIQNGIEQIPFDASAIMQKLLNGEDISDTAIQGYVEALNEQLKATFDETEWPNVLITFDADTKQIVNAAKQQEKEAKKTTESWNQTAQAVQQLGQAMQQIEDPTAKAAGTVLQAISSVALGFAQASVQAASMGPWGWVAFLAAGIAAMTTTINTMHSLTGFANGGIIPGNSMSGDNLIGMTPDGSAYGLNAQEVVLNRAQVGNLASQLEGGVGNLQLETRVGAEELIFILNNNGNRRGFGNFIDD